MTMPLPHFRQGDGKGHLLVAILFLACLPRMMGSCSAQTLPPSLQAVFEGGVAAVQAGRLDEAEEAFLQVLRGGGKVAFVYNNLGVVYQMRGNQARAIAQFREAIRLQPNYAAPRILLGASLLALGQDVEATRELERAVKIQPDEPVAHVQLAHAYKRTGNYAGLVEQYRALHSLQPDDPESLYQLGHAYSDQAKWCLIEIRKIDPNSVRLYETLGESYRLQGHLDLAASAYKRAAAVDPKWPGIHLALAQICLQQGEVTEARKEIDEELAIVPESVAAQALAKKIASERTK
jgi:tetratricopeptide (TPR) repeat protein